MKVICVARLVKTKRLDQLIGAVQATQDKLTVIGFGPEERRLKRLAGKETVFLKRLPRRQLIDRLKQAEIFCLPSVVEGFGIATIEAMACGLPAVLADIPVNREITRNGRGAVFFEPENMADLIRQLNYLKTVYWSKRAEALKLAQTYTWEKIYQQTKQVYEACFYH
jgi:glycosyltransferase involved in cell wall biosynthesis